MSCLITIHVSNNSYSIQNQTDLVPTGSSSPGTSGDGGTSGNDGPSGNAEEKHKENAGPIAGGVVGGVVVLGLVVFAFMQWRSRRIHQRSSRPKAVTQPEPYLYTPPFGQDSPSTSTQPPVQQWDTITHRTKGRLDIQTSNRTEANIPTSSSLGESTPPSSVQDADVASPEVRELRVEVESLRRAVGRLQVLEAPPTYYEE